MGTEVQYKSYLPGYYPMRDLNDDSNICGWPLYYEDKTLTNGQYYNGFSPTDTTDEYLSDDKNAVKRTMLEHEAIFKNQVYELHRVYRIQRDLMNEIKRRNNIPVKVSLLSSPLASQIAPEDARRWHLPSYPLANASSARPCNSGAEEIRSSLSYTKGNSRQAGNLPLENGGISNKFGVLDCRPAEVRRRLLDLQLPADEHVDGEEGEQVHYEKLSETGEKYPDNGEKTICQEDTSTSASCFLDLNGLADLNQPLQLEETNSSINVDLPSHGEAQGCDQSSMPKSRITGLQRDVSLNSSSGSNNVKPKNLCLENNIIGRGLFQNMLEAGHNMGSQKTVPQGLQMDKLLMSSQPMQVFLNKFQEPPTFTLTEEGKLEQKREGQVCGLQFTERNGVSYNKQPGAFVASHISSPYAFGPAFSMAKSWSQMSSSIQTQPHFKSSATTLHKSSRSSGQINGLFGDMCGGSDSKSHRGFGGEIPCSNGFYLRSSSGLKGVVCSSSTCYDYPKCSSGNNKGPEHAIIDPPPRKFHKDLNYIDMNSPRDIDLNGTHIASSLKEAEQKNTDHHTMLPLFRATHSCKNEATNSGRFSNTAEQDVMKSSINQLPERIEYRDRPVNIFSQNVESVSCSNNVTVKRLEPGECPSRRKLLGFPIFEVSRTPLNNPSKHEVEDKGKARVLDINLPYDSSIPESDDPIPSDAIVIEKTKEDLRVSKARNYIDLNLCVSDDDEDEESLRVLASSGNVRVKAEIDLEAPVVSESEDIEKQHGSDSQHEAASLTDELMTVAAEAIIAISSSKYPGYDSICNASEDSFGDPLNWLADIVISAEDYMKSKVNSALRGKNGEVNEESSLEEIDYFESMTLGLIETKEGEYMPEPLIPESIKVEETGTFLLQNRPRKGQGRRGRQRRDFQRDILPGLASLSRHEVTEDLQTFGGLMRASGHSWQSGLSRRNCTRNGCGRGRRRAVVRQPSPPVNIACNPLIQKLNNVEVGLEDGRLTGWGKTTRRPRRQRFPAGNHPPSVPLT